MSRLRTGKEVRADPATPPTETGSVPQKAYRIPTVVLWFVPFLFVAVYVLLVDHFFHAEALWTGDRILRAAELLLIFTGLFSLIWYAVAYGAAVVFGEFVSLGVLKLVAWIPGLGRHVVITPSTRPDTRREVWGRFGVLFLISIGFELIFLILIVQQGDLAPSLAVNRPIRFFPDEALAGLGLGLLLAPAAPFLASRLRTRITDSLEFPLLWLAALLLVVGGSSILLVEVLPGFVFDPALFFTSVLLYAPAAWYMSLAFSNSEELARRMFLHRAWAARRGRFHFGRISVTDEPDGTTTQV